MAAICACHFQEFAGLFSVSINAYKVEMKIKGIKNAKNFSVQRPLAESAHKYIDCPPVQDFKDVIILKRFNLILNKNWEIIPGTMNEHVFWYPKCASGAIDIDARLEWFRGQIEKIKRDTSLIFDALVDFVYLGHPFEWYAYGHIFDSLQRLFYLRDRRTYGPYILTSDGRRVSDFHNHLTALGFAPAQMFQHMGYFDFIRVPRLIYSESPAVPTQFTEESMGWIRDQYLGGFLKSRESSLGVLPDHFILYLDRSSSNSRGIINSESLVGMLKKKLPVIVFHGDEGLARMLQLFSKADYVVGAHGAMFVNTIFCKPEARIMELIPENRVVTNMLSMCKSCINHLGAIVEADENFQIFCDLDWIADTLFDSAIF